LQQSQTVWQSHHDQLIRFSRGFENRLAEMLEWAKDVYSTLEEIHEDVIETQKEVKITKGLVEEILEKLSELMARQGLSSQVKARDEFTQHNSASLQLIRQAASQLKQLPSQNPKYSRLSIMVGSALSSTGELELAERLFMKAIEKAKKDSDKALAYFNLFQVQLRRQAYSDALKNLQAAIAIEPERYALHDIHKYPLEKLLGAGGMGCVFLCRNDNQLIKQEKVVVKCFWENLKGTLKEVFKEPFLMRDIAGDAIPTPLDFGYVDFFKQERAYFVTEYIDGAIDGEMWLEKSGPMDLKTGLAVGLKIAQGLQIAHEAGICHLDLKPANILLLKKTSDVSVKIIDFGLSQVATSLRTEAAALGSRAGTTLFGQAVFGTLDYAPPEQQGLSQYGKPSATSDVFSFGATMYRLWTGESPRYFRERELPAVSELRDLLFDCVKTDPKQRPESARELVSRLKAISESQNADQRAIEPEEAKKRQAESREQPRRYEKPSFFNKLGISLGVTSRYTDNGDGTVTDNKTGVVAKYRYTDNGDGTVTDNKTGLIWLKNANCSGREMTWKEAMQWAAKLAHGQCGLSDGSKAGDWHLPTKDEWEAMMDKRYSAPALSNAAGTGQWKEGDAFSDVPTSLAWYWSSTEYNTSSAWSVLLSVGYVDYLGKTNTNYVWAVRDGH
jgi:serine/threonine protein kinase